MKKELRYHGRIRADHHALYVTTGNPLLLVGSAFSGQGKTLSSDPAAIENALHMAECWNIVEAMGGDSDHVIELLCLLKLMTNEPKARKNGFARAKELLP